MMNKTFNPAKVVLAFSLGIAAFSASAVPTRAADSATEALQLLKTSSGGAITSALRANDAYAGVHALPGAVLVADDATATPLQRAQNFLASYGAIAGVTDPLSQLVQDRVSTDRAGITHIHLNQTQSGLPVFGARLVVHMTSAGIVGVNGVFVPGLESLSITPEKDFAFLRDRGLVAARKLHPTVSNLSIESTRLMVYRSGLLKGVEGRNFLAYEVVVKGGTAGFPVREHIILNAHRGTVLNAITGIHSVLNRVIYSPNQDTPAVLTETTPTPVRPADPPLKLDDRNRASTVGPNSPQNNLFIFAGGTWALYKNLFGVADGYDFTRPPAAGQQQRSVYLINEACPNAYWNGDSTNYCPGFDADDIVSHEWSHAYTEYTHGLVYQYQSGALNESYSDIFGETYDLVNALEGPLGTGSYPGGESAYFEDGGSRWVLGEDLSDAAAGALLRDMWDPDNFGPTQFPGLTPSPGSTTASANYFCGTGDSGGVHTNSGVPNHAYAMLVDGKTYNNVTIPAIGMTKAAHIYFQAMTQYQTPTSNFVAHADALEQSCRDLTGKPLNDVTGALSTERITAADCAAVTKAIEAVEFRNSVVVKCNYLPVLKAEASTPALCPSGMFVTPKFSEGFNDATLPTGWTQGKLEVTPGDVDLPPWTVSSDLPAPHIGNAAFFPNNGEGTCAAGGDASASHFLDTPEITVSTAADFFKFTHFMQSEALFDGGNLKVSLNGGAFALVPAAAFTYNGHSGRFSARMGPTTPTGNNTSPNGGQLAWTGSDQGEATGSWGTTVVDLSKLTTPAAAGSKVKFRFDFANDGCGGNLGWFVEDVTEFICTTTPPPNLAPVAALTLDKTTGEAPLTVQVTRGGSDSDAGDRVVSYTIAYGDGSTQADQSYPAGQASTVTSPHVFNAAGTYTLTLTVKDSFGLASNAVTRTVTVTPKAGTPGGSTPTGSISPAPVATVTSATGGRFGGGALGALALLPLAAMALRRRRKLR